MKNSLKEIVSVTKDLLVGSRGYENVGQFFPIAQSFLTAQILYMTTRCNQPSDIIPPMAIKYILFLFSSYKNSSRRDMK